MTTHYVCMHKVKAKGRMKGATHVLIVCDTFTYEDYPVYVMPGDDLNKVKEKYNNVDMQRIHEVIEL